MVQVERTGKKCTKRKGLIFFITRFARTAKIGLSWDLGGAGAAGTKKKPQPNTEPSPGGGEGGGEIPPLQAK